MAEEKKVTEKTKDFVSSEELNTWSLLVKEEFEKINAKIAEISGTSESKALEERTSKIAESVSRIEKYLDYLAETTDQGIQYSEYVAESLNKVTAYTEYVAEMLNHSIDHQDYIVEMAEKHIKYSEYLKEQMEKQVDYSEYLKECLENTASYAEYVAEMADHGISYSEHLAEKINLNIDKTELLAENLDLSIAYSEYLAEQTQQLSEYTEIKLNEKNTSGSSNEAPIVEDYKNLPGKVDSLIESIKKQKVEETNESLNLGFLRLLNEAKREEFRLMDETKKQKVTQAVSNISILTPETIEQVMESVLHPAAAMWIEEAPAEYKEIWNSLDESSKRAIAGQAQIYTLDTPYKIKNFWETRNLDKLTKVEANLNESKAPVVTPTALGYSKEYLDMITAQIGGKFGK
jgi:hypothetical protein